MDNGKYAVVGLSEFVAAAKMQLFGTADGADLDILFGYWANEAVRHYDCLSLFVKKQCTIQIQDKKGKLPNGFNSMLGVRFSEGTACGRFVYVDMDFLSDCGFSCSDNARPISPNFQIQDGWIYLQYLPQTSAIVDGEVVVEEIEVDEIHISYLGLNVDDSGLMVAYSDMERGIRSYICWQYCLQNNNIPKYGAQADTHRMIWQAQKRWIKSTQVQDHFRNTRRQVAEWANALVVDKNAWGI